MTDDSFSASNNIVNSTWMDKDRVDKPAMARFNEKVALTSHSVEFTLLDEAGQKNDKTFTFRLSIGNQFYYIGKGKSKKVAKNDSALLALEDSSAWFTPRPKRQRNERDKSEEEEKEDEEEKEEKEAEAEEEEEVFEESEKMELENF